ncbi:MAG: hypothetical protein COV55_03725 [Candidatus Komeilibacteria bacterium CG11_big_fil_rev_8_21_14_0_20_36_20]|uniref:Uncharacterized protein n=1 Tax=Candidatus Komeilibacteria bacterium CG11_big_fil_rev_8_21_14_0_20_36_20 TaxID=1974477 RepID=A0A2H0NEU7_9BACT|nr:MAG: hypothetical protein COV55_03725 [Candidatus Komeilibacteria bacterium CG11_big_fil_rev_8_21_14_0_20_36_20]PIR81939.1 MAG: hypothetical protein COU21_01170 [Candidatus Komeilibacteria bacterium CG10_big_fil_rev_8_21_14_0_10_36_65]PJC55471.1 MAG: hypothetical protein CO027_01850 [Candidatus Komeilibacteria bacterium CG_4_9_14_0_2_um_filter_36_13]
MNFVKNKKLLKIYSFLILGVLANPVLAQSSMGPTAGSTGLEEAAQGTGLITNKSFAGIISLIIKSLLSLLGMLFLVLIIWGGFKWMTSQGSSDKVNEAKDLIINATIGLVIVVISYAIVRWVLDALVSVQNGPAGGGDG